MKLKSARLFVRKNSGRVYPTLIVAAVIAGLMLYKLGSLTRNLALSEAAAAHSSLGWYGIYIDPFFLPLKFIRSLLFVIFNHHGQTVVRLGNTFFGVMVAIAYSRLVQLWYGGRTALLSSALFITSAWVLHISRFASNDVLYLVALPILFYLQIGLKKAHRPPWLFCAAFIWGLALYVPGLIWLIAVQAWLLRAEISRLWKQVKDWRQKVMLTVICVSWLPLLLIHLLRSGRNILIWLGLPLHVPSATDFAKQFAAVPVHLFIHGPKVPVLWLGRTPILDIFSLICCVLGIYFYAKHFRASRSKSLFSIFAVSWLLVALGGAVSLSLIVPLLYLFTACGLGYLLHDWLKVFPKNPLARSLGISLIAMAVAASSFYNLRAYFVAWPHNPDTVSSFNRIP